jgi:hypothetical protein
MAGRYNRDMNTRFFALLSMLAIGLTASLPATSATKNVGGSTQTSAQSGCMNKWMFDGMWRVRVTKVVFVPPNGMAPSRYDVTMQWANGTSMTLEPSGTQTNDPVLQLKDGDTVLSTNGAGEGSLDRLTYHAFPPSGQLTYTQQFYNDPPLTADNLPVKLLITFNAAEYRKARPDGALWRQKTINPNYRIDLTCGGPPAALAAPAPVPAAPAAPAN